jgi:hypothetical protein
MNTQKAIFGRLKYGNDTILSREKEAKDIANQVRDRRW